MASPINVVSATAPIALITVQTIRIALAAPNGINGQMSASTAPIVEKAGKIYFMGIFPKFLPSASCAPPRITKGIASDNAVQNSGALVTPLKKKRQRSSTVIPSTQTIAEANLFERSRTDSTTRTANTTAARMANAIKRFSEV